MDKDLKRYFKVSPICDIESNLENIVDMMKEVAAKFLNKGEFVFSPISHLNVEIFEESLC